MIGLVLSFFLGGGVTFIFTHFGVGMLDETKLIRGRGSFRIGGGGYVVLIECTHLFYHIWLYYWVILLIFWFYGMGSSFSIQNFSKKFYMRGDEWVTDVIFFRGVGPSEICYLLIFMQSLWGVGFSRKQKMYFLFGPFSWRFFPHSLIIKTRTQSFQYQRGFDTLQDIIEQ